MDNWVTFLLVNVVLALVVSIFGTFATEWIKLAYQRSIFSSKKKRIISAVEEYKMIKGLKENNQMLVARLVRGVMSLILLLSNMLVTIGLILLEGFYKPSVDPTTTYPSGYILLALYLILIYFIYLSHAGMIKKTVRFDKFKEKTIAKIIKLGGNPEDLDKEEVE